MVELALRYQATPGGRIALWSDWGSHDPTKQIVIIVHGALRDARALSHWATRFQGTTDVVLLELPGHGRSDPIPSPTVVSMADHILSAVSDSFRNRKVTMVCESLGGLIGLEIAGRSETGPITNVIACDPPMTTAKLWNVQNNLLRILNDKTLNSIFKEEFSKIFWVFGKWG
ncbi:MAG: hypothetical protein CGW95_10855 [Phenylobacterium zucineum]|nr:MAG: hypothetical protein CGW95_10855 [Phenylobacterium zucineum]